MFWGESSYLFKKKRFIMEDNFVGVEMVFLAGLPEGEDNSQDNKKNQNNQRD